MTQDDEETAKKQCEALLLDKLEKAGVAGKDGLIGYPMDKLEKAGVAGKDGLIGYPIPFIPFPAVARRGEENE